MFDLQHETLISTATAQRQGIGGKAANLFELADLGFSVPKFVVIPFSFLDQLANSSLHQMDLTQLINSGILEEIDEQFPGSQGRFAVRSSADLEDGQHLSYAGQFSSELGVTRERLAESIVQVWSSAHAPRVTQYQRSQGIACVPVSMSIIVQEMVASEVSGVAFGIDLQTQSKEVTTISATFGLGEGLVSGELNADEFTVQHGAIRTKTIAQKTQRRVLTTSSDHTTLQEIPSKTQRQQTLNESQCLELHQTLQTLEKHFGHPQDVEFAFVQGKLHLLQSRPITTYEGEYTIWDNSNIVESYPGVTTPLTFSFIEKMYEAVYTQLVGLFGVHPKKIEKHADVFANTLGLVRGRVYYNLLSWYKMLAMVPGFSINAEFMENMMGVKERFKLKEEYGMSKGIAWLRILKMVSRMIALHKRLPKDRRSFKVHLDSTLAFYQSQDLEKKSLEELIELYEDFEVTLVKKWEPPLTNDFFAMIWFGILQKMTSKLSKDEHQNLHNDLLCGSNDIISTEPIFRLMAIAKSVELDPTALFQFKNLTAFELWNKMENGKFTKQKEMLEAYIRDFGDRCFGELKLESISYRDAPDQLIAIVQNYLIHGLTRHTPDRSLESTIRAEAEKVTTALLKGKPLKRALFRTVLKNARSMVSHRENLRYERTRAFGMVRKLMNAIGRKLHSERHIHHPRDVFYLELQEIIDLKSTQFHSLREIINQRKAQFREYGQQQAPSERFFTYGKNFADQFIYSTQKLLPVEEDLQGIGCSPGQVQGKVRIVKDPSETSHLEGDILVTTSTDPGWVTLFPTASAILVERGSLLSHSAIVSRELGIPCIVGITGLLRSLKTGDTVVMDGSSGVIKLLNDA